MAIERILVGVDFSPESFRAVDHAMAIARHAGASLTLAQVVLLDRDAIDPSYLQDVLAVDRRRMTELRERLDGKGVEVSQVMADGYADTVLAETARALRADLVVVGTHGRTGIKRLLIGSVAERTVRLADVGVLVARRDPMPGGYRRVVVGTDYAQPSVTALARAFELVATGGEVRVVHAWQMPYVEYELDGAVYRSLREAAAVEADAQEKRLWSIPHPPGVRVSFHLAEGVPFEILDDLSADADLVVVGSHGRRGLRRFFVGSVAEATVRHARASVLVAR